MSSVFDPTEQNKNIDAKIVAGLERISRVFRVLLWDMAKKENLSPIQIQFLIYLLYNKPSRRNITSISEEFNLTKATVSDAISSLEKKNLIKKDKDIGDKRSSIIKLTPKGKKVASQLSTWTDVLRNNLKKLNQREKETILEFILKFIESLYDAGVITLQRMCFSCVYLKKDPSPHSNPTYYCNFLAKTLSVSELRLDCDDYEPITQGKNDHT